MAISMKRSIWIFVIAVLFVSMVSCDKEEEKQDPNSVPVYVRMYFTYNATESMIEYCDIVAKHSDGIHESTYTIKADDWKELDDYSGKLVWTDTVEASLPAVLSFARVLTVKDSINKYKVDYVTHYSYRSVALNANKDTIPNSVYSLSVESYGTHLYGYDSFRENGTCATTYVYYYNKDGKQTDSEGNLRK